jgi:hypothetical protein
MPTPLKNILKILSQIIGYSEEVRISIVINQARCNGNSIAREENLGSPVAS